MSERTPYIIEGEKGDWEVVMGMEVHAQVASNSKLFSGAPTKFGADPNCNVSLVDAAMPGMLPVINEGCVEQAVRTGLGPGRHLGVAVGRFQVGAGPRRPARRAPRQLPRVRRVPTHPPHGGGGGDGGGGAVPAAPR